MPAHSPSAQPPFALAHPAFPFRALVALAARAPIGPGREVALAWFVCARLVEGGLAPGLPAAVRAARATAARAWLGTASVPAACRVPLAKLIDACGGDSDADHARIARAFGDALAATGDHLDGAARAELEPLLAM